MKQSGISFILSSTMLLGSTFFTILTANIAIAQEAQAQAARYIAFRPLIKLPESDWNALLEELKQTGIKFVEDSSLNRSQILVFPAPVGTATLEILEILLSEMIEIPVTEYKNRYGTISSVHTGYFFLQFEDTISMEEARARLEGAGFKITSPKLEVRSFIVVEGTRLPEDKDTELARLNQLKNLLYVSPDNIPVRP